MTISENIGAIPWTPGRPERNPADFANGVPGFVRIPLEALGQFTAGLPTPMQVVTDGGTTLQHAVQILGSKEGLALAEGLAKGAVQLAPKVLQLLGGLVTGSGVAASALAATPLSAVPYLGAAIDIYAPLASIGGPVLSAVGGGTGVLTNLVDQAAQAAQAAPPQQQPQPPTPNGVSV